MTVLKDTNMASQPRRVRRPPGKLIILTLRKYVVYRQRSIFLSNT